MRFLESAPLKSVTNFKTPKILHTSVIKLSKLSLTNSFGETADFSESMKNTTFSQVICHKA